MSADGVARPVLTGRVVRLRPGHHADVEPLLAILAEPPVARWWGEPGPPAAIEQDLRGEDGQFHDGPLMDMIPGELAGT
jgi:hypothetical protein